MNKLLWLLFLAFCIAQQQAVDVVEQEAFELKNIKIGVDFNSEYEIEASDYDYGDNTSEIDLESGFSIGIEFSIPNTKFSIGVEYLMPTEFEDMGNTEISHISFYGLVPLLASNTKSDFQVFGKVGYSMLDLDVDGAEVDIDASGGLMYGIQLEMYELGFSYTIHNGEWEYDNFYYGDNMPSFETKTSRFTLSYHLHL